MTVKEGGDTESTIGPEKMALLNPLLTPSYYEHLFHDKGSHSCLQAWDLWMGVNNLSETIIKLKGALDKKNGNEKKEKPADPGKTKGAIELDRFKRRLIRSVARLLLEKKPVEEIWKELKKETGCDCELLWARMEALTVKKLNRLFLANDCMDAMPAAARMTLTDWLMFDLVLVHQKIDLIGLENPKNNKEDSPVLVELFDVVQIFNIEKLSGNSLAEAWSLATLYYNNQGHQCSPMLLQRRWYQLREVTRFKFYHFWYEYRGNTTRINHAEPYRPTPLQTEIAKTFKSLITQPFLEWEAMIEQRLVTMPEEFEINMKERVAKRNPFVRKPSIDAPDLVMIEPRIETIDLRLESDDKITEQDKQEEDGISAPPPVRIKQEPQDDMDIDETLLETPKKSIFEVVLESTALENLQFDSMDAEENDPENNEEIEENTVRDEEEPVLPQIGTVFGNVTDTSVLANIDENRVYGNFANIGDTVGDRNLCNEVNPVIRETITLEDAEQNTSGYDKDAVYRDNSVDGCAKDNDNCDNTDENSARNNDQVIEVSSDDKDDVTEQDAGKDPSPDAGDNILGEINDISDDDYYNTGYVDSSNFLGRIDESSIVGNVIESSLSGNVNEAGDVDSVDATNVFDNVGVTNVIGNVDVTNVIGNVDVTNVIGNVHVTNVSGDVPSYIEDGKLPVTSENIPNIDVLNAQTCNSTVTNTAEVIKDVEIIDNPSQPVVIIDSDEDEDIVDDLIILKSSQDQPMEVHTTPEILEVSKSEPLKVNENNAVTEMMVDVKPDVKDFCFGELPPGIIFADEGIEFVDKGKAYFDEDSQNEIDIKEEDKEDDAPTIDSKLLMVPVVYTTRLDDMGLFHTQTFNHIEDKPLLDAITKKSIPIMKETVANVNNCEVNVETVTVNDNVAIEGTPNNVNSIDDKGLIVKEEPLYVDSENIVAPDQIPIESIPENDNNVTSDDSDSDDSLDESLKVKPTSYLLQKPRSRRYNPIQLCKNPDFNTRLKRLSVGFFGYPRNRLLIKSCKPLTIDLSKAFESKLISGTLYLKPADNSATTEVINDTESHSVSVVPSALPAQSLIDNSKVADILPILQQCLVASKQPVDLAPTSERNKIINLPDITEIRRINQRLLTAEVTPIQVQNNQLQVPVTIVTSSITPTCDPEKAVTTAETDSRSTVTESTNIPGPPQQLESIDDSPAKTSTEHTVTSHGHIDLRFIDGVRPRQSVFIARPAKNMNPKRFFASKPTAWKPRSFRPAIPWLIKNNDAIVNSRKFDETLLTLDALNKMLFLLTDNKDMTVVPPKNQKTKVRRKNAGQQTISQRGRPRLCYDHPPDMIAEEEPAASEMLKTKCRKPKFNIKSATNYPPDREKNLETGSEQPKKRFQYCCWARQRMLQLLFRREHIQYHSCSKLCKCCCRNLLKDYILQDNKMKPNQLPIITETTGNNSDINLVKGGRTYSTFRDSENQTFMEIPGQAADVATVQVPPAQTVQVSGVETVLVPDNTPVIDVEPSDTEANTNEIELIGQATNVEDHVPSLGGEVSVTTTAVLAPLGPETPIKPTCKFVTVPILKNHDYISNVTAEAGTQAYQYTTINPNHQSGGMIFNSIKTPNTTITPNMIPPPSLTKLLSSKKSKMLNAHKINSPRPIFKPFETPKHTKEKMIFLNSKQISEKPTASPLHLGKNKILLTTIKFPSNLRLFHEAKNALKSSLNLPIGVHIILLADGTVTYKIDPNVEVTATDMKEMPTIIAAISTHMATGAAKELALSKQHFLPTPAITGGEVVDLVDDDDASAPNVNETPLVANVQTTEQNVSHESQMDMSNEIEENRRYSCISTNVIATESNQNMIVDQNTVINIQGNSQESTQNEMVSASTGPLEGQPEPSLQLLRNVKIIDVHGVSPEKSQDQLGLSSQQLSAEIGLAETSNQIVSSDLREVLAEQTEVQSETTVCTEVPEEKTSESSKPKSKNILSDLMEMSGIFDDEINTENEATAVSAPEPVVKPPVQTTVLPLANSNLRQGTNILQPILIPTAINRATPVAPKIQSAIGELSAITSLYELKYACANKGIFFKLDIENGYLVPINVCMKGAIKQVRAPVAPTLRNIAPKSVIDLTEDDDKSEQQNESPVTSPSKRSLLLVNNSSADNSEAGTAQPALAAVPGVPSGFIGPARPVKLFKALKPSILQRLNLTKINRNSKNIIGSNLDTDTQKTHKRKRKQFLKKINLNADSDADNANRSSPVRMRQLIKKVKLKRPLVSNEPTPSTSRTKPQKQFATPILSDDSSDDEPLAKKAKKKNENMNAPESVTEKIQSDLPVAESEKELIARETSAGKQIGSELSVPDTMHAGNDSQGNELPAADTATENFYLSDGDIDAFHLEPPFGIDVNESNEENEDHCILGV